MLEKRKKMFEFNFIIIIMDRVIWHFVSCNCLESLFMLLAGLNVKQERKGSAQGKLYYFSLTLFSSTFMCPLCLFKGVIKKKLLDGWQVLRFIVDNYRSSREHSTFRNISIVIYVLSHLTDNASSFINSTVLGESIVKGQVVRFP